VPVVLVVVVPMRRKCALWNDLKSFGRGGETRSSSRTKRHRRRERKQLNFFVGLPALLRSKDTGGLFPQICKDEFFSTMTDGAATNRDIRFPGAQDFQLFSSDGYTFHLSRQILAQASGFFADMFAIGSSDPGSEPVTATEEYTVLNAILRLAYGPHGVSAPTIPSFATLTALYRAAEKYEMHAVLQCLLSILFHPRVIDDRCALPFIKTHPIPSLALLILNGSQLGVHAAMQECILADKRAATSEIDFSCIQIDVRMVIYIHSERHKRIQFIMSHIEKWPGCERAGATAECLGGLQHMALRHAVEDTPTLAALTKHLFEKPVCPTCGQDTTTANRTQVFSLLTELQFLEQFAIPLPSVSTLLIGPTACTVSVY